MNDKTLDDIDGLIKNEFSYPNDIKGFDIFLTDFIYPDSIDCTIYLNPRRDPSCKYLITGDNAFINFKGDENSRLGFAKRLKNLLVEKGLPCFAFMHKNDCKNGCKHGQVKWDFNKKEIEL